MLWSLVLVLFPRLSVSLSYQLLNIDQPMRLLAQIVEWYILEAAVESGHENLLINKRLERDGRWRRTLLFSRRF